MDALLQGVLRLQRKTCSCETAHSISPLSSGQGYCALKTYSQMERALLSFGVVLTVKGSVVGWGLPLELILKGSLRENKKTHGDVYVFYIRSKMVAIVARMDHSLESNSISFPHYAWYYNSKMLKQ